MDNRFISKKKKYFWVIVIFVLALVCNCNLVNAVPAIMNYENFNISFKNISLDDEISIELENYDEEFTNDDYRQIIKVTFKNDEIIEAYEEDVGYYSYANEELDAEYIYDILDRTSLIQDGEIVTLKIRNLGLDEIGLATNVDFQVTVYQNGEKIIDRGDMSFNDDLYEEADEYNRYYYSNFEVDLANKTLLKDNVSANIGTSTSPNYVYIVVAIFVIIVAALAIIILVIGNRNKVK